MIKEFFDYQVNVKKHTLATATIYMRELRAFAQYMRKQRTDARWSNITMQDLYGYMAELTSSDHKPATINRIVSTIKSFYNWLVSTGKMEQNPIRYAEYQKDGERIVNTIDKDDLIEATMNARGTMHIILLLLVRTGIRTQELLDIERSDLETGQHRIKVHGKGNKDRYAYLTPEETKEIADYFDGRQCRPFAGIPARQLRYAIYDTLRRHCNAKQLSPHAIRHSFATWMAQTGANAQTIANALGHRDIRTAQRYIDANQVETREAMIAASR